MATFLFDKTIFGPVKSRRLGISLGINLLPNTRKVCNFNCIYCECGWNPDDKNKEPLPSAKNVEKSLAEKLSEMKENDQPLDVITFAGNGEPTMHPEFPDIIDITCRLRNQYFPNVRIAVLSNATLLFKPEIVSALKKVDQNILKIDSANDGTCRLLNNPVGKFSIIDVIENLKLFDSRLIVQTMFVKGSYNGVEFDNTSESEINALIEVIATIKPAQMMIYTIARDTPIQSIQKISQSKLKEIASKIEKLGIPVSISA
jgi:wyosine [tRNA(Phe)-imidazoG37] synthetase (radical SAM superfamily)